jgi:hypothetical protein
MRSVIVAGVSVMLMASVATATTNEVFFPVRGSNACPLNAIDPSVDPWLIITTSVRVTGDNQGLAGYWNALGIRDLSLPMGDVHTQNWAQHPVPKAYLSWASVYDAPPTDGIAADVTTRGTGPGMSYGTSTGWPEATLAFVDQMGAGYLEWLARRYVTSPRPGWVGDDTWGVGLDSRKSVLLLDPNGTYDLNVIAVDLSDYHPGDYRVDMEDVDELGTPKVAARVVAAGVDLNVDRASIPMVDVDVSLIHVGSFEFTIVPEPATVLLVGASLALLRRRRV